MSSVSDWLPPPDTMAPGNAWPRVLSPNQARLLDALNRVDAIQHWPYERIEQLQLQQVRAVLRWALRHNEFTAERIRSAGLDLKRALTMDDLRRMPILTRADLQRGLPLMDKVPPGHGQRHSNKTSGSTGEPVEVALTDRHQLFYRALGARDHAWAGRDPSWTLATIRHSRQQEIPEAGMRSKGWALGQQWSRRISPTLIFDIRQPIHRQAELLAASDAELLVSYPSNLAALAGHCMAEGIRFPGLQQIATVGEMLTATSRAAMEQAWGVPVRDLYSSEELGYIASPCPEGEGYHVHAEGVLVEVLHPDGRPCAPGETGRLVITALQNLATAMIRYEIRDWATQGAPCGCGRGLPVLTRIVGRERNMLRFPDGSQRWPLTGYQSFGEVIAVRQFQFVQTSLEEIEVRLVARDRAATPEDEAALTPMIQEALGYAFTLNFVWMDDIPTRPNGKHEEFISELD